MPDKQLKLPVDEQVGFFLPILDDHIKKLAEAISTSQKNDLTDAEWIVILSDQKSGKFLNHHFLSELWDEVAGFLSQKSKLYFFMDAKAKGLVEKSYKFWLFFSPATAAEYFTREIEKPSDFGPQNIKPVPFPDLVTPLLEEIERTLTVSLASNVKTLEKLNQLISIADYYLDDEAVSGFDSHVKKMTSKFLHAEIEQLKKDIQNPAASPGLVKKRLRLALRIGWRYYRAKNELETNYFKKIISEDTDDRMKGLNLASKKISDYITKPVT